MTDVGEIASVQGSDAMAALLYEEMHRLARRERWHAGRPDTMQTTAIMHEAYLKLYKHEGWASREHFLGTAVTTMRHVLVNAARARMAEKRGSGMRALPLEAALENLPEDTRDAEMLRLNEALTELATLDPKLAKLVDCRFFAGMSNEEAALLLGVTERTVHRWWTQARAWLHSEMAAPERAVV